MASNVTSPAGNPIENTIAPTKEIQRIEIKTGAGVAAQDGAVPVPVQHSYQAVVQSLGRFFPGVSSKDASIRSTEVIEELKNQIVASETNKLINLEEMKRQNAIEEGEKAKEQKEAQEAAERASKKSGLLGSIGNIFAAIGAAFMMGVGVFLAASGVGAAVGAALLIAGSAALFSAVDGMIQEHTDHGMFGHMTIAIMTANGHSMEAAKEKAAKVDMGVNIAVAVVAIVASLATLRFDSAAEGALLVAQHTSTGVNTVTMMGSVATQTASSYVNLDAARHTADSHLQKAESEFLKALNEQLNDFIDQSLKLISQTKEQFHAMLDEHAAQLKDDGETFSKAKWTA